MWLIILRYRALTKPLLSCKLKLSCSQENSQWKSLFLTHYAGDSNRAYDLASILAGCYERMGQPCYRPANTHSKRVGLGDTRIAAWTYLWQGEARKWRLVSLTLARRCLFVELGGLCIAKNSLRPKGFLFLGVVINLENVKLAIGVCSQFVRQADRVMCVAYHSHGEQLFG